MGFSPEELIGRATPMPYWPPDAIADSMSRHLRNMAGGAPREGYFEGLTRVAEMSDDERRQFSTAPTPAAISSSAETRSRSS